MIYTSVQKNVNSSPRKLRLVADMIRKMTPDKAIETLYFTNKAAAQPLAKAIKTALANAKGENTLFFDKIEINEGIKLKRFHPIARGRTRPYKRRFSHIKVVLTTEGKNMKVEPKLDIKAAEIIEQVTTPVVEEPTVVAEKPKRVRKEKNT